MTIDLLWRGVAVIYASDEPTAKRVATLIKSRGVAAYAFPHFTLDKIWGCFDAYVFVMAAGGVVRSLCGRLKDKWSDPPVLIVDHNLSTILPILGHHRGADELADWLASLLGAKVVHTTMSRHLGFSPVEAVERQMLCKLNNADILEIYKTLARGGRVCIEGGPPPGVEGYAERGCDVVIRRDCEEKFCCRPLKLYVGFGAKSDATVEEIVEAIRDILKRIGANSIEAVASIKPVVTQVAELLKTRAVMLTTSQLTYHKCLSPPPRQIAQAAGSIAEAAAMAAAGPNGELLYRKTAFFRKVTVAVAGSP